MKVGLEVHQQLATGKLFCRCPSELSETVDWTFTRRLRASSGEDRAIDAAAAFQASLQRTFEYQTGPSNCLVEMDEEPPRLLNADAVDVALTFALLVGARPVDEVQVMRKIVVDGSNTAGFQRTALLATGGEIDVGGRPISLLSICLEEDAARKIGEREGEVAYRLDRLGIPLIEIATGPEIQNGEEARAVAEEIGALLRSTRRVRRGIGTIREDLNVSVEGGHRIEIKGVQELRKIHEYVSREAERQEALLRLRETLSHRPHPGEFPEPRNLTPIVAPVAEGPLGDAVRNGGAVVGVVLPAFAGLLGSQPGTSFRFGRELADQARAVGPRGLVHSDELPGYGIREPELAQIRSALGATGPQDAIVLVADRVPSKALEAARRIAGRARAAFDGVPGETRDPLTDGSTRYSRPLPGRDRMYPETDVAPLPISSDRLEAVRAHLPERPAVTKARLEQAYGLSSEVVRQLLSGGYAPAFEELTAAGHPASTVARLLTQELPAVGSEELPESTFGVPRLKEILAATGSGRIAKEGIPVILAALAAGAPSVDAAIERSGLGGLSSAGLEEIVDRVVGRNADLVRSRGTEAFSALMGDVMKEVRGRWDGQKVAEALRRRIAGGAGGPT